MSDANSQPERSITFRRVTYLGGFLPFQFDSLAVNAVVTSVGLELWSVRQQKPSCDGEPQAWSTYAVVIRCPSMGQKHGQS